MKTLGYDNCLIKQIKKQKVKTLDKSMYLVDELCILEKYLESSNKRNFCLKYLLICKEIYTQYRVCENYAGLCINAENIYEISEKTYRSIIRKTYSEGLFAVLYGHDRNISDIEPGEMKTVVVLDGLEYPGNIGTIFRTADAAKIDCIILTDCALNMNNEKIISGSRGMVFKVPFYKMPSNQAIKLLLSGGFNILLCEPEGEIQHTKINYSRKTAIVFGSEKYGISKLWFAAPHTEVYIPMNGNMHSLNVGVAASIIMYESYLKTNQMVESN